MGFSSFTRVLTEEGYQSICDLKVGDRLPTPLGVTQVTACGYYTSSYAPSVWMGPMVEVLDRSLFLADNPFDSWGVVSNEIELNNLLKMGLISPSDYPKSLIPDSRVFSYGGLNPGYFKYPPLVVGPQKVWVLCTDLNLAVVGPYISGLNSFPNPENPEAPREGELWASSWVFPTDQVFPKVKNDDLVMFLRYLMAAPQQG